MAPVHVKSYAPVAVSAVRPVGHEAAGFHKLLIGVNNRQPVFAGKLAHYTPNKVFVSPACCWLLLVHKTQCSEILLLILVSRLSFQLASRAAAYSI